jgi:hypothetical protein
MTVSQPRCNVNNEECTVKKKGRPYPFLDLCSPSRVTKSNLVSLTINWLSSTLRLQSLASTAQPVVVSDNCFSTGPSSLILVFDAGHPTPRIRDPRLCTPTLSSTPHPALVSALELTITSHTIVYNLEFYSTTWNLLGSEKLKQWHSMSTALHEFSPKNSGSFE